LIDLRRGRARWRVEPRGDLGEEGARLLVGVAGHHGNITRRGRLQDQVPQKVGQRRTARARVLRQPPGLRDVEREIDRGGFQCDGRGEIAQRDRLLEIGFQLRHGFVDGLIGKGLPGDRPAGRQPRQRDLKDYKLRADVDDDEENPQRLPAARSSTFVARSIRHV
jgi:hypothetical protein